jgi:hypothetical protein
MGDNITDTRTTAMDTEIVPPVVFDVNTTLTSTHRNPPFSPFFSSLPIQTLH